MEIPYDKGMKRSIVLLFMVILSAACILPAQEYEREHEDGDHDEGIILFHGKRMNCRHGPFMVMKVCMHEDVITVRFNMPVDPRTVNPHAVHLDGRPLPPGSLFRFNKEGMLVEMKLPPHAELSGMLDISGIRAFDGSGLRDFLFDCSDDGCRYIFRNEEEEHED